MVPTKIVRRAKKEAAWSDHRFRVGAVIYRRGEIHAGYNHGDKTHPLSLHPYKSIHAEFDALLSLVDHRFWDGQDLSDYSIYVHRLKKDDSDGLAKPCQWCQKMLDMVGIKQIYYSQG